MSDHDITYGYEQRQFREVWNFTCTCGVSGWATARDHVETMAEKHISSQHGYDFFDSTVTEVAGVLHSDEYVRVLTRAWSYGLARNVAHIAVQAALPHILAKIHDTLLDQAAYKKWLLGPSAPENASWEVTLSDVADYICETVGGSDSPH